MMRFAIVICFAVIGLFALGNSFVTPDAQSSPLWNRKTPQWQKEFRLSIRDSTIAETVDAFVDTQSMAIRIAAIGEQLGSTRRSFEVSGGYWEAINSLSAGYGTGISFPNGSTTLIDPNRTNHPNPKLPVDGSFVDDRILLCGRIRDDAPELVIGIYPTPRTFAAVVSVEVSEIVVDDKLFPVPVSRRRYDQDYRVDSVFLDIPMDMFRQADVVTVKGSVYGFQIEELVTVQLTNSSFEIPTIGRFQVTRVPPRSDIRKRVGRPPIRIPDEFHMVSVTINPKNEVSLGSEFDELLHFKMPLPIENWKELLQLQPEIQLVRPVPRFYSFLMQPSSPAGDYLNLANDDALIWSVVAEGLAPREADVGVFGLSQIDFELVVPSPN